MSFYFTDELRKEAVRYRLWGEAQAVVLSMTIGSVIIGGYALLSKTNLIAHLGDGYLIGFIVGLLFLFVFRSDNDGNMDDEEAEVDRLMRNHTVQMLRQMTFVRKMVILGTALWPVGLVVWLISKILKLYDKRTGWNTRPN